VIFSSENGDQSPVQNFSAPPPIKDPDHMRLSGNKTASQHEKEESHTLCVNSASRVSLSCPSSFLH
jgi:hypothetical protein